MLFKNIYISFRIINEKYINIIEKIRKRKPINIFKNRN